MHILRGDYILFSMSKGGENVKDYCIYLEREFWKTLHLIVDCRHAHFLLSILCLIYSLNLCLRLNMFNIVIFNPPQHKWFSQGFFGTYYYVCDNKRTSLVLHSNHLNVGFILKLRYYH